MSDSNPATPGIVYLKGDATAATGGLILHICNDQGAWGAGFVMALSARDKGPEESYRAWYAYHLECLAEGHQSFDRFALGRVGVSPGFAGTDACVVNMVAQRGFPSRTRRRAVDYGALAACLDQVSGWWCGGDVHMPRVGCGIGGGSWDVVEDLVHFYLVERAGCQVFVYDYEPVAHLGGRS